MAETRNFDAPAFTVSGSARERVSLPAELFDGTVNMPVMHRAVTAFLANQRQGNASTKIRKYVVGGNQKPWRQKGTGRARQGSIRAPHWVGGGTVFGPTPRSYAQYVPRQVRALARKSAFNARAREGAVLVVDQFDYDAPKTRRLLELLTRLEVATRKVLILTDGAKPNVYLSGRNLPKVHVMPYRDVSTYHLLWSDVVLIEASALGQALEPMSEDADDAEGAGDGGAVDEGDAATGASARGAGTRGAPKRGSAKGGVAKRGTAKRGAAKRAAGTPVGKRGATSGRDSATKPAAKRAAGKKSGRATKGAAKKGAAKKKGK